MDLSWAKMWVPMLGLTTGLVVLQPAWHDYQGVLRDRNRDAEQRRPVIEQHSVLVAQTDEYVDIHILGERLRGDECQYLGIQAYTLATGRAPLIANIERPGAVPLRNETRPLGPFDGGVVRVRPLRDPAYPQPAESVLVQARYLCNGFPVRATLAEVSLSGVD